jgi:UDP-2,3-diacylglucosamine hydrolase
VSSGIAVQCSLTTRAERSALTTLFISDLHLDAGEPAAGEQFIEFLATRASSAAALYILGDLFETWVGDDDNEAYRDRICVALARLGARGVACYVMHGNRDFLYQQGFAHRTGARLIADPIIVDLYGEQALLTHGDALCVADRPYQLLRGVVRDPHWQRRFLQLPLATRRSLAEQARHGSQRHTQRTASVIMDADQAAVLAVMRACGVRTLIHGHTHRPAVHEFTLDDAPARRIVLGAWHDRGSALSWSAAGFRLEELPRSPAAASITPVPPC